MKNNEIQKNQINEADYIDITIFIRAFFRLARRYLLLVCPLIVCLTASIGMLARVLVKEQYVAEASVVIGVTRLDDFSYSYTLPDTRNDNIVQMSNAFRAVVKSEYMSYLLQDKLGRAIPGEIYWENAHGTNMGGVYAVSDSMENAVQLRDAVISCLPKALFTTLGDIDLKVLKTTESAEILHENLKTPFIWGGAGIIGGIFAYFGIIFLFTLWRHDIETPEDMLNITDLPCLGRLPKSGKTSSDRLRNQIRSRNNEYNRSFSEFRTQLAGAIEQKKIKTLLFTGGYKMRGQNKILDKLTRDWISQGKKVKCINWVGQGKKDRHNDSDSSKAPNVVIQIREEMNQLVEKVSKEADLLIINGPDFEQTVELLATADCVDGIVYIVKEGYDQMENTKEAICSLGFTQAELLGYVITA